MPAPTQLGRISGPLLKANLVRDGVDLAFETDLLYLNVTDNRIGINTSTPDTDLEINGDSKTTNLEVTNRLEVGNFTIGNRTAESGFENTIRSDLNTISFVPSGGDATIYQARLVVDDIQIQGNVISTEVTNSNLELRASGTGIIDIQSPTTIRGNLDVTGNVNATGNVQIDGNIIIGNEITDTITINAAIKSSLLPETTSTYDLGSSALRWNNLYAAQIFTDFVNLIQLDVGNLIFTDNRIESTTSQDIIIDAIGTGRVILGNFAFRDNTITNIVSGSISEIAQTGTGYFKIQGTGAFVPPVGNDATRPTAYAVVGMTRYNTNSRALEIWDGFAWASPAGASGAVSEIQANDIAATMALTLG
jgi:hypothetical protein